MGLESVLAYNYTALCLVIGMSVLVIANRNLDRASCGYFMACIAIICALTAADIADYYLAALDTPSDWRYVSSALGYVLRPASVAIIITILTRRKRFSFAIWTPIVLLALVAFTSKYTHLMFWFDGDNLFQRGPLGYLSHIIGGAYVALLVVKTLANYRYLDHSETAVLIYIAIICAVTTVLESVLSVKFLLPGVMVVSCALYYVIVNVQLYKRDVLTGLLNRRSFFTDSLKLAHTSFAIIAMDLNGLKDINDSQGHQAGDRALCAFADTMVSVAGRNYRVYRTGGDEFVALGKERSAEDAELLIEKARPALEAAGCSAAFGYAVHSADDSVDAIFGLADEMMFRDKSRCKHRGASRSPGPAQEAYRQPKD